MGNQSENARAREERAAEALRQNLRRRKTQQQARDHGKATQDNAGKEEK